MHLYERLNIDVLERIQERNPMDFFSGRFEDVCRNFLQNFKNKQWLTFKNFTQQIWWVGSEIIQSNVVCIIFQTDVLRRSQRFRYADLTLGRN